MKVALLWCPKYKQSSILETCCTLKLILCLCFLLRSGEEQSPPAICRQHIFRSVVYLSNGSIISHLCAFILKVRSLDFCVHIARSQVAI